jgi:hypothetical protein
MCEWVVRVSVYVRGFFCVWVMRELLRREKKREERVELRSRIKRQCIY